MNRSDMAGEKISPRGLGAPPPEGRKRSSYDMKATNANSRITLLGRKSRASEAPATSRTRYLQDEGWLFVPKENYRLGDPAIVCAFFREIYGRLPIDPYGPGRARAHIKLRLDVETGDLTVAPEQSYSQPKQGDEYGDMDRKFARVSDEMLDAFLFQSIVASDLVTMMRFFTLSKSSVTIGVHCVRYLAKAGEPGRFGPASYAYPLFLHKDDEPVVFLHVLNETPNLIGGDSLIACDKNHIDHAFHLAPLDAVLLTKNCWHAVTPMAAPTAEADGYRDILLITLEEDDSIITMKPPLESADSATAA